MNNFIIDKYKIIFVTFFLVITLKIIVAQNSINDATIIVNNTNDSGSGSLRNAIENASSGDIINFNTFVFLPNNPATILLDSGLPILSQGNLTIDASDAGVILDGSSITTSEVSGISIHSDNNIIRGLHIVNFSKAGISLESDAKNNIIGGDRNIGDAFSGQGNIITGNGTFGIGLWSEGTSFNTLQGNIIGTDINSTTILGSFSGGIFSDRASNNVIIDNIIGGYQDNGVSLGNVVNGHNTVQNNYIGTNITGTTDLSTSDWSQGICISNSSNNIIGPDNIIANNGSAGINIQGATALNNHITKNSIYNNEGRGIELWNGGNAQLAAPILLDFNRGTGIITGAACSNGIIEIYTGDDDEGTVYEGETIADNRGIFTFNKGASFDGTYITATVTDKDDNTSQFSESTPDIPTRIVNLQDGNNQPKTRIEYKRSDELDNNRIGSHWDLIGPGTDASEWNSRMVFDLGLTYASILFNSKEGHTVIWNWPELSIDPARDAHVNDLFNNGVTISFNLAFWDVANHPNGWEEAQGYSRFQIEEEIQRYLDYVQFIVHNFKDRIQYYELWNEPDNGGIPIQYITVTDYINLVKRVVPIIRQEYSQAKIVVGSVSNLMYSKNWLLEMIKSDEIMPLVDVIGWHPFYGQSPADENTKDYYYQYPSLVQEIMETASDHGFNGEFRADEIGWAYYGQPHPPENPVHSIVQSTKYLIRGTVMHLGMDMTAILGGPTFRMFAFNAVRNLCTVMDGAEPEEISIEIQSDAPIIKSYGFSLPNGEKMVALWNDNVAVDNDPGVQSTLILHNFSNQRLLGIDVLNGYKQELITDMNGEDLIIRDLVLKDYPLFISTSSLVKTSNENSPFAFGLFQNFPNPFNPITNINYNIKESAHVSLAIYNILGQTVKILVDKEQIAGNYSIQWDGFDQFGKIASAGIYFYRLKAGDQIYTKKMLLIR